MRAMPATANLATAIVIGLGNIGSHLVPHVARMPGIGRVVLIDPDVYGDANRSSQAVGEGDIGRAKAAVQAEVVHRVNPDLAVTRLPHAVEDVPLGCLRGDLILTCLDSRVARQYVNEAARSLGVPWIDAGVEPGSWLVRVNVYEPGAEAPCLECAWDQRDYDALPQRYPCRSGASAGATAAPSSLGALAASLQALECQKLLTGQGTAAVGAEVLVDAGAHTLFRTEMRRHPACRLTHSEPFEITRVESNVGEMTLEETFVLGSDHGSDRGVVWLHVPMHAWAGQLTSGRCGHVVKGPRLHRAGGGASSPCPACGGVLAVSGFDLLEKLGSHLMAASELSRTLEDVGLRDRDVVGIGRSGERRYVELGGWAEGEQR